MRNKTRYIVVSLIVINFILLMGILYEPKEYSLEIFTEDDITYNVEQSEIFANGNWSCIEFTIYVDIAATDYQRCDLVPISPFDDYAYLYVETNTANFTMQLHVVYNFEMEYQRFYLSSFGTIDNSNRLKIKIRYYFS